MSEIVMMSGELAKQTTLSGVGVAYYIVHQEISTFYSQTLGIVRFGEAAYAIDDDYGVKFNASQPPSFSFGMLSPYFYRPRAKVVEWERDTDGSYVGALLTLNPGSKYSVIFQGFGTEGSYPARLESRYYFYGWKPDATS